jgi:tetratricopeptide (TPR) repeat protein
LEPSPTFRKNYGSAAKYFKKAVALDETRASFHVNLGAAWFSQKKLEQAIAEYTRAVELDPDALNHESKVGVAAQIASPEERARYSYMLAKIYAKRGDVDGCLQCLKKAKEEGYRDLANVYKDEEFSKMRDNPKLHEVVPPPTAK